MREPVLEILLIEDNPGDAQLVEDHLRASPAELTVFTRLDEGIAHALVARPDVVLLDLNLPDSDGLATVGRFLDAVPNTPVVVLTVLNSEELGGTAVDMGAQDYLVKERVTPSLLMRALRFAVLRHAVVASQEQRSRVLESEVRRLRALLGARESGQREPLRTRAPAAFEQIVTAFGQRVREDGDDPKGGIVMARMMADLAAGPRDVMDVYARFYAEKVEPADRPAEQEDLAARGRLRALELMGRLVELYSVAGPRGRGVAGAERRA